MQSSGEMQFHATTILMVRKGGRVVVAGDGQVTLGATVIKHSARKVRPLGRGDVVGRDDVVVDHLPRRQVGALRSLDPEQFVGMAARRPLRPGQPVSTGDFTRPTVVTRGDTVTVVYETASLTVTSRAQAVDSGAVGDLVTVVNPQSKRTIHATVAGPGRVVVNAGARTVAAIGRTTP